MLEAGDPLCDHSLCVFEIASVKIAFVIMFLFYRMSIMFLFLGKMDADALIATPLPPSVHIQDVHRRSG